MCRGEKATLFEGGVRGLAFLHSPDRTLIPEHLRNTVSYARVHAVDWLPTLLGVAGADLTLEGVDVAADGTVTPVAQPELDGIDVWPILTPRVNGQSASDQGSKEESGNHPLGVDPRLRQLLLNFDPFMEGRGLLHGARFDSPSLISPTPRTNRPSPRTPSDHWKLIVTARGQYVNGGWSHPQVVMMGGGGTLR